MFRERSDGTLAWRGEEEEDREVKILLPIQLVCGKKRRTGPITLAWCFSWLKHHPMHQKVASSVPRRDMYQRQPGNFSLSLSLSLSLSFSFSLKSINISSGDYEKKRQTIAGNLKEKAKKKKVLFFHLDYVSPNSCCII